MNHDAGPTSIWRKYRRAFVLVGLVLAIALWWLFRPERLFINQQVEEQAPAGIAAAQPEFTGSLHAMGNAGETAGRVNIVKDGNKLRLEIVNFESKAGDSFTVELGPNAGSLTAATPLGVVTVAGNQKLEIPAGVNPAESKTVLLTDDSHRVIAEATLEAF